MLPPEIPFTEALARQAAKARFDGHLEEFRRLSRWVYEPAHEKRRARFRRQVYRCSVGLLLAESYVDSGGSATGVLKWLSPAIRSLTYQFPDWLGEDLVTEIRSRYARVRDASAKIR